MNTYHRFLNNIGSRSLNRSVYRVSLGDTPNNRVPGIYISQITTAPHNRLHVPFFPGFLHGFLHVTFHSGVKGKIAINQFLPLFPGYFQPFCQSPSRNAVNNSEISRFRSSPHLRGHFFQGHVINLGCRCSMHILASQECVDQFRRAT